MHFNVMVPVLASNIVITDEIIQHAKSASEFVAAANARPLTAEEGEAPISEYALRCASMVSTPFAFAVVAAAADIMEAYCENAEDPKFFQFFDETENLQHSYETGTMEAVSVNGKLHLLYKFKGFKMCKDGVIREIGPNGQVFLSDKAKKMIPVTVPIKQFYKTFRQYAKTCATYYKEQKAWGVWCNPNAICDSFAIDGRWSYGFLVKENCEDVVNRVQIFDDGIEPTPAPNGFKWVLAAKKRDIEAEKMTEFFVSQTRQEYAHCEAMWNGTEPLDQYVQKDTNGLHLWGRKIFDPTKSIDDVLADADFVVETIISRKFEAYVDTINTTPGDGQCGYYDKDCIENWDDHFQNLWSALDDDDIITVVNCHG